MPGLNDRKFNQPYLARLLNTVSIEQIEHVLDKLLSSNKEDLPPLCIRSVFSKSSFLPRYDDYYNQKNKICLYLEYIMVFQKQL